MSIEENSNRASNSSGFYDNPDLVEPSPVPSPRGAAAAVDRSYAITAPRDRSEMYEYYESKRKTAG